MKRRTFLKNTSLACLAGYLYPSWNLNENYPPVRAITKGPAYHWFGYYDKNQFDPSGRYVLGMQVNFEHRSPTAQDTIRIGMVDLQDNDRWIDIGESNAWGWQQGCMLQWIPGSATEVIWNDRQGKEFVSHILDTRTGKKRTLPRPVYALSPDGKWAIGTHFERIQNLRPGYGYAGIADPNESVKAPKEAGIYRMELGSGQVKQLLSLYEAAQIPHKGQSVADNWHWFNHLLINTDGSRFTFLHRWREKIEDRAYMADRGFVTRMFTANADRSDLYILDPSGFTSHFIWRDPTHICAWTRPEGKKEAFYLFEDKTTYVQVIGEKQMTRNGHNTYLPIGSNEWILNDTYPDPQNRMQTLYVYHIPTDRKIILGQFHSPEAYKAEWRCDLHPRYSPDGKKVVIDSTHGGKGRQMYLVDISKTVL